MACCVWNGQVEIDALRCFNRTAVLTHDPPEIRGLDGPSQSCDRNGSRINSFSGTDLFSLTETCLC